ncbi:sporulation histidine kinase inhibitor Sda [Paenibacillus sp. TRM 82003]|nr:sporulation histidine kinase inhibitor Sda [Paenibacillus sp. TRM 82003]
MIRKLSYETLCQVYQDSIKYSLDKEFIELLEAELKRRGGSEEWMTSKASTPPSAADYAQ